MVDPGGGAFAPVPAGAGGDADGPPPGRGMCREKSLSMPAQSWSSLRTPLPSVFQVVNQRSMPPRNSVDSVKLFTPPGSVTANLPRAQSNAMEVGW